MYVDEYYHLIGLHVTMTYISRVTVVGLLRVLKLFIISQAPYMLYLLN